ncbi:Ig-like domain-containing protein [Ructibacterium gallinarum]|uniref:Uncharacterized protein n=1 Tax=Ructibacterium gallinarum TaxID=2779355 RepID=A0A9D5LZH0_9FIRM|nr:hypothetical protein [Ructibacterium gallinarum]MBE5040906.1 hypothetical protein [Ructibacterium gallinarum]
MKIIVKDMIAFFLYVALLVGMIPTYAANENTVFAISADETYITVLFSNEVTSAEIGGIELYNNYREICNIQSVEVSEQGNTVKIIPENTLDLNMDYRITLKAGFFGLTQNYTEAFRLSVEQESFNPYLASLLYGVAQNTDVGAIGMFNANTSDASKWGIIGNSVANLDSYSLSFNLDFYYVDQYTNDGISYSDPGWTNPYFSITYLSDNVHHGWGVDGTALTRISTKTGYGAYDGVIKSGAFHVMDSNNKATLSTFWPYHMRINPSKEYPITDNTNEINPNEQSSSKMRITIRKVKGDAVLYLNDEYMDRFSLSGKNLPDGCIPILYSAFNRPISVCSNLRVIKYEKLDCFEITPVEFSAQQSYISLGFDRDISDIKNFDNVVLLEDDKEVPSNISIDGKWLNISKKNGKLLKEHKYTVKISAYFGNATIYTIYDFEKEFELQDIYIKPENISAQSIKKIKIDFDNPLFGTTDFSKISLWENEKKLNVAASISGKSLILTTETVLKRGVTYIVKIEKSFGTETAYTNEEFNLPLILTPEPETILELNSVYADLYGIYLDFNNDITEVDEFSYISLMEEGKEIDCVFHVNGTILEIMPKNNELRPNSFYTVNIASGFGTYNIFTTTEYIRKIKISIVQDEIHVPSANSATINYRNGRLLLYNSSTKLTNGDAFKNDVIANESYYTVSFNIKFYPMRETLDGVLVDSGDYTNNGSNARIMFINNKEGWNISDKNRSLYRFTGGIKDQKVASDLFDIPLDTAEYARVTGSSTRLLSSEADVANGVTKITVRRMGDKIQLYVEDVLVDAYHLSAEANILGDFAISCAATKVDAIGLTNLIITKCEATQSITPDEAYDNVGVKDSIVFNMGTVVLNSEPLDIVKVQDMTTGKEENNLNLSFNADRTKLQITNENQWMYTHKYKVLIQTNQIMTEDRDWIHYQNNPYEYVFNIENSPTYVTGSTSLDAEEFKTAVQIPVSVFVNSIDIKSGYVLACTYNEYMGMLGYTIKKFDVKENGSTDVDLNIDSKIGAEYLKVFLIDDPYSVNPLCEGIKIVP